METDTLHFEQLPGDIAWPVVKPLAAIVYPPEAIAEMSWRHVAWAHASWRLLARDAAGAPICTVGGYHRDATLDRRPVHLGGIGGVMTHPEHRRKGLVRALMARAVEIFQQDGVDWALLVCETHNVPVYTRLGWRLFHGATVVEQPHGPVVFTLMHTLVFPIRHEPPVTGRLDLCGKPW